MNAEGIAGSKHVMAVIGGAVSGAEAAATLAERGIEVVVFDQNDRPYGKIEDGLPRWHDKQRAQEYERINSKLDRPGVHFVPRVKLGREVQFDELVKDWGFSAVLLAIGAWRDRPLGVEGEEKFLGKGLIYQNSLIYWFNHYNEKGYNGPEYECIDDAMVIGGGLASFDVAKVLMLETVGRELTRRDMPVDMLTLEHKGIAPVLAEKNLTLSDLGLKGCTLYYRRRALDMPVANYKENATLEEKTKTEEVRARVLQNAMSKYLFRFAPNHLTDGLIVEGDRLVGLKFIRTEIRGGKVIPLPGTDLEVRSPMIVSSIGSVPEPLPGIPRKGEFYQFAEGAAAKLQGYETVFGVGNVVTGKGNIAVSRKHGAMVAQEVAKRFSSEPGSLFAATEAKIHDQAAAVAREVQKTPPASPEQLEGVLRRVRELQQKIGYLGGYRAWLEKVTPADME